MSLKKEIRSGTAWLRWIGAAFTFAGALALVVGGILPWARFTLLGMEVGIPGVLEWGAVTMGIGLLVLSVQGLRRRLPLLVLVLGFAGLGIGMQAQKEAGKVLRGRLLALENGLAPVNARLAQVTLPPIEPFGPSIGRSRDYLGPGPAWTIWGGVGLALGGTLGFVGGRLGRSCRSCGFTWRSGRIVHFCPSCGTSTGNDILCTRCQSPLEGRDRFCVSCGSSNKIS